MLAVFALALVYSQLGGKCLTYQNVSDIVWCSYWTCSGALPPEFGAELEEATILRELLLVRPDSFNV